MSYAQVTDNTITAVGGLPKGARRLDDGGWVLGLRDADISLQAACGWLEVVDPGRPPDTETTTSDRTLELLTGIPTYVYTVRDKTDAEITSDLQSAGYVDPTLQVDRLSDILIAPDIIAGTMTNIQVEARAKLFSVWVPGVELVIGQMVRYEDTLYEVIQDHTTQMDWAPDITPALFKLHRTGIEPWAQPISTTAYIVGDQCTHLGNLWTSTHAANVWEPGVAEWTDEGAYP